jgi:hypothetical protein
MFTTKLESLRQGAAPRYTPASSRTITVLLRRPHCHSPQQPGPLGELVVSLLLLCVPAVVPWRRNRRSLRDRIEPVAACFAPPCRRHRLCANHRVEPYACRCRCRPPRTHPRSTTSVCPSCRVLAALSCEHRPRREHRPPCARLSVHKPNQVTILLPFHRRAHAGQGAALAQVLVGTRMPSAAHAISHKSQSLPFRLCSSAQARAHTHARE